MFIHRSESDPNVTDDPASRTNQPSPKLPASHPFEAGCCVFVIQFQSDMLTLTEDFNEIRVALELNPKQSL